jgi:DNA gyrase subunit B
MQRYAQALAHLKRLRQRYDPTLLEALTELPPVNPVDLSERATFEALAAALAPRLAGSALDHPRYTVEVIHLGEAGQPALRVTRYHHGSSREVVLSRNFFEGPDYAPLADLAQHLGGLLGPGAVVARGGRAKAVTRFAEAHDWLMEQAKRNREIGRFKGLGEMNPEQLWETTVNPETRRLLKVGIEDAIAADQMFSMLMGEAVEPRREFIEANALRVANLDV